MSVRDIMIQKLTDRHIDEVANVLRHKEQDIMAV